MKLTKIEIPESRNYGQRRLSIGKKSTRLSNLQEVEYSKTNRKLQIFRDEEDGTIYLQFNSEQGFNLQFQKPNCLASESRALNRLFKDLFEINESFVCQIEEPIKNKEHGILFPIVTKKAVKK